MDTNVNLMDYTALYNVEVHHVKVKLLNSYNLDCVSLLGKV